jgi:hypothetical protein
MHANKNARREGQTASSTRGWGVHWMPERLAQAAARRRRRTGQVLVEKSDREWNQGPRVRRGRRDEERRGEVKCEESTTDTYADTHTHTHTHTHNVPHTCYTLTLSFLVVIMRTTLGCHRCSLSLIHLRHDTTPRQDLPVHHAPWYFEFAIFFSCIY